MEQFDSKYFRGQGALFMADRDANGAPTGLIFVGDLTSASLTPNMERSQVIENVTGANGVGASWIKRTQYNIAIAMRSVKPAHLAEALQGASAAEAAASVTTEAATAYLDKFTQLQYTKLATPPNVVVTGAGGTPSYVEGTDYKVHADEGMIEWLSGGTITDATAVEIDYDYAAQHHVTVDPANLEKYLVFAGKNTADNDKQTRCEIYSVKLDPGVLSLITDEAADMTINGVVQLDALRAAGDQFYSWKLED